MSFLDSFEHAANGEIDFLKHQLGLSYENYRLEVVKTNKFGSVVVRQDSDDLQELSKNLSPNLHQLPEYFLDKLQGSDETIRVLDINSGIGLPMLHFGQQLQAQGLNPKIIGFEGDLEKSLVSRLNCQRIPHEIFHGTVGTKFATFKTETPNYDLTTIKKVHFGDKPIHVLNLDLATNPDFINWQSGWLKNIGILYISTPLLQKSDSISFDGLLSFFGFVKDDHYSAKQNPNKLYVNRLFLDME